MHTQPRVSAFPPVPVFLFVLLLVFVFARSILCSASPTPGRLLVFNSGFALFALAPRHRLLHGPLPVFAGGAARRVGCSAESSQPQLVFGGKWTRDSDPNGVRSSRELLAFGGRPWSDEGTEGDGERTKGRGTGREETRPSVAYSVRAAMRSGLNLLVASKNGVHCMGHIAVGRYYGNLAGKLASCAQSRFFRRQAESRAVNNSKDRC